LKYFYTKTAKIETSIKTVKRIKQIKNISSGNSLIALTNTNKVSAKANLYNETTDARCPSYYRINSIRALVKSCYAHCTGNYILANNVNIKEGLSHRQYSSTLPKYINQMLTTVRQVKNTTKANINLTKNITLLVSFTLPLATVPLQADTAVASSAECLCSFF